MPSTMNGVGTHYWGKANLETRWTVCEHCGRAGDLRSYDTTKYFVLFYLPLIPLGKLHILDECPHCTRHQSIKLDEWRRLRKEAVAEALAAYFAEPDNRELAEQALGTCAFYREGEEVLPLVAKIYRSFGEDVEMVAHLAGTLDVFDQTQGAESAYRRALALSDTTELREALAGLLIRDGRPEEAQPLLGHVFQSTEAHAVGQLLFLVEGYQAQGKHREALEVLKTIETGFPQYQGDKTFRKQLSKMRKNSEKNVRSGKPVVAPSLTAVVKGEGSGADWGGRFAVAVWPLLILLIVGPMLLWMMRSAESHEVYLVSGLDHAYQIEIAGERYTVPAGQGVTIDLPRGEDLVATVQAGGPDLEPVPFRVDPSFGDSLFGTKMYVLNPDRLAVLLWAQSRYSETPDPNEQMPYEFQTGEPFYMWEGVDYEFEEFPDEISISSGTDSVVKTAVNVVAGVTASELFYLLLNETDQETSVDFLRRRLPLDRSPGEAVMLLSGLLSNEELLTVAAPRLEVRPVAVEWHRAYQSVREGAGQGGEVKAEYEALLRGEPENSSLHYLLARIEVDAKRREALLRRAIDLDANNAYAHFGLAYGLLAEGRNEEALAPAERAVELMPFQDSFQATATYARFANGRFEELLSRVRAQRVERPLDGNLVAEEVNLLNALGREEEIEPLIRQTVDGLADPALEEGWGEPALWEAYLKGVMLHAQGDEEALLAHLQEGEWAGRTFQAAVLSGDAAAAVAAIEEDGDASSDQHLLAYLVAREGNHPNLAREQLQAAIELLYGGSQEEQILARALASEPVDVDIKTLALNPQSKALALVALAQIDRRRAPEYLALARRLNYQLAFPRIFLDRYLVG